MCYWRKAEEKETLIVDPADPIYAWKKMDINDLGQFMSPQQYTIWHRRELKDPDPPTINALNNRNGIFAMKNSGPIVRHPYNFRGDVLVKVALSGVVHRYGWSENARGWYERTYAGYRAQEARIVEVYALGKNLDLSKKKARFSYSARSSRFAFGNRFARARRRYRSIRFEAGFPTTS